MKTRIDYSKLARSFLVTFVAALAGSLVTYPGISGWYASLAKPALSPPNWVFGPVWTLLYIMMAMSAYRVLSSKNKGVKKAMVFYYVQLSLNVLWSALFFGLRSPFIAFVEITVLWLAVAATIIKFQKISKNAAWLLIPYLIWITFAAYLNYSVWILN